MMMKNICPFCCHSIADKNTGLGIVGCRGVITAEHKHFGCGNAYAQDCLYFMENPRMSKLKEIAVEAIRAFNTSDDANDRRVLAVKACALQEAFAAMLDISFDEASEFLHQEVDKNSFCGGEKA